jgi:hypothetical protein
MSKFLFKVGILGKTTKEKKTNHEQKQAKELKISVK